MKHTAGIFVEHRALETLCINALNSNKLGINVFSDATSLFKSIVDGQLEVLIVDSSIQSEDVKMIERYRLMSPTLFIIVLGENPEKLTEYVEAGCNAVTDAQNLVKAINEIQIEKTDKNVIDADINPVWRLSTTEYALYSPVNNQIKLTVREYKFLKLLFDSDDVLSKEDIKNKVIGGNNDTANQRIALLVARLRKKVYIDHSLQLPIKADYCNGYVFAGLKDNL